MRRRLSIVLMSLLFVIGFSVFSFAEVKCEVNLPDYLWVKDNDFRVTLDFEKPDEDDGFEYPRVKSVESSNPDVIEIVDYHSSMPGSGLSRYGLAPKKVGTSIVTVVYTTESGTEFLTKKMKVKKYPSHIKSLTINGKKIKVSKYKYNYEKKNSKVTKLKIKVTPNKGWKLVKASSVDLYFNEGIDDKTLKTKIKKGSTIKIDADDGITRIYLTMRNTKGEEIKYTMIFNRPELLETAGV